MAITYTPIATYTLPSAQGSYTLSGIPSTYTDLILIIKAPTISANFNLRLNGDTGTNYSDTNMWGNGTSAVAGRSTNNTVMALTFTSSGAPTSIIQLLNYSSTTKYKTVLIRQDDAVNAAMATVGLWRNANAISSITIVSGGNLPTGTTFNLYGILGA